MKNIQKLSILSVSLLTIMASAAMAPALSTIKEHFNDVDPLLITLIITLPAPFIILMTLITGKLVFYFKKKSLLTLGVILYLIGGLLGGVFDNIYILLSFRVVMGIGVGLLLPLATGIIADFFDGEERSHMMGLSTSFNNLGGLFATVLAGFLATIGWQYPFLIYTIGVFTLLMVLFYLPNQDIPENKKEKSKINKNVWFIAISMFMLMQIFFEIVAGLSYYIDAKELGEPSITGSLIAMITIGSFGFSMFFAKFRRILKSFTGLTGVVLVTFGVLVVGLTSNLVVLFIALLVIGFGLGITAPNLYLLGSLESDPKDVTLSLAIVASSSFLGQFASPLVIRMLQSIFNYHTVNSGFILSFYIGVLVIIVIILNRYIKIYVPKSQIKTPN